ncbi:MAG: hypothetical protein VB066_09405 [Paludibacter sp.]|nr:hypothetical protein [Paludibacter sp.]
MNIRKRVVIESVEDELKNKFQIEHARFSMRLNMIFHLSRFRDYFLK